MYSVLLLEDDDIQRQLLENTLREYPHALLSVDAVSDYDTAILCIGRKSYDFFVLDIVLSDHDTASSDGVAVGRYIRSIPGHAYTPIIYITSVPERIGSALKDTRCMYYLLKPWSAEEMNDCLNVVLHSPMVSAPYLLLQTVQGEMVKIPEAEIRFITRTKERRIAVRTKQGTYETRKATLTQMEQSLPQSFLRIHKNCIVNAEALEAYHKSDLHVSIDGYTLPVGRMYKKRLDLYWRLKR